MTAEMAGAADKPTREEGAPIPKDEIDPELVKLRGPRTKVGAITAAGMVFLALFVGSKFFHDWTFSRHDTPVRVQLADVLGGKVDDERFVELPAEPVMSHAIRIVKNHGDMGLRITPARGTNERLWLVLPGDGWDRPITDVCRGDRANRCYIGRLRRLADLPFADAVQSYAASHPRSVFASAAAVRAGFATNTVTSVSGDQLKLADRDRVVFEIIDPAQSTIIVTFIAGTEDHPPLLDAKAWAAHLGTLGLAATPTGDPDSKGISLGQARFSIPLGAPEVTKKLEEAQLWAARVEPVTRHHETTWGALRSSAPGAFTVDNPYNAAIPDAQIDLVGLQLARGVPGDAYVLITNDRPADYWHVTPILILVAAIALLFAWALVRAVRRDLLPARA